ncbi:MAG TPA: nucleotidyltransferase domain-containing protein [Candidatus Kapabacteria bacterium]|nr:nucleotidyltransferase domain-containing protein [Candidatus Kapabacteria bacterium]HPO64037.1 nucleotidyltransferase domain-containing protein [Candidatus Kapabacteria bacterium]
MLEEINKYRLDETQKQALIKALDGVEGEIYLFGSRVDVDKKGGDVDILILSESNEPIKLKWDIQTKYLMEADESIDVIVFNPKNIKKEQQAFVNSIKKVQLN